MLFRSRVYVDPSIQATLVYPHSCSCSNLCNCTCGEYTTAGCIYVRSPEIGSLDVRPATYAGGSWRASATTCCGKPQRVRINYQAGMNPTSRQAKDAVVRLAHAKMPQPACACDEWRIVWQRDTKEPEIGAATREVINCPFGNSRGSWTAWRFANAMRLVRGGVL